MKCFCFKTQDPELAVEILAAIAICFLLAGLTPAAFRT